MSAKKNAVDLLIENQNLKDELHEEKRSHSVFLIRFLIISVALNVLLFWAIFFHFPVSKTLWTNNAGAVCAAKELDADLKKAHIDNASVLNFATEAAISAYTFDYVNFQSTVNNAAKKFFTDDFYIEYMNLFNESKLLRSVIDNLYIVSAVGVPNKPPQLVKSGVKNGVRYWQVNVPIKVYYVSGRKIRDENLLAMVEVVRTNPVRVNPIGVAVNSMITGPLTN